MNRQQQCSLLHCLCTFASPRIRNINLQSRLIGIKSVARLSVCLLELWPHSAATTNFITSQHQVGKDLKPILTYSEIRIEAARNKINSPRLNVSHNKLSVGLLLLLLFNLIFIVIVGDIIEPLNSMGDYYTERGKNKTKTQISQSLFSRLK